MVNLVNGASSPVISMAIDAKERGFGLVGSEVAGLHARVLGEVAKQGDRPLRGESDQKVPLETVGSGVVLIHLLRLECWVASEWLQTEGWIWSPRGLNDVIPEC